jgi:hypothetical protein
VGPDATIELGALQLNTQYLRRRDSNPGFTAAGDATEVHSAFAEVVVNPIGANERWTFAALYNWIDADAAVLSFRAGDAAPAARYHTASAGVHYLLRRNVRIMGELGYDIEHERSRFTLGTVLAF